MQLHNSRTGVHAQNTLEMESPTSISIILYGISMYLSSLQPAQTNHADTSTVIPIPIQVWIATLDFSMGFKVTKLKYF